MGLVGDSESHAEKAGAIQLLVLRPVPYTQMLLSRGRNRGSAGP